MRGADLVTFGATVLGFALFVTAHLAIAVGLTARPPRWRSLVALVVVPLALYWAIRERMIARSVAWAAGAVAYVAAIALTVA